MSCYIFVVIAMIPMWLLLGDEGVGCRSLLQELRIQLTDQSTQYIFSSADSLAQSGAMYSLLNQLDPEA